MRTDNSIKNFKYNTLATLLYSLITFITRTIFVKYLGQEYLGVNGLFSNILTILSLADLGIGTVLIYSMYKPLAEKNEVKIKQLMNLYKKIYNIIALAVLSLGLTLMPFLEYLIEQNNIPYIHLIFFLYLINTVISYLCIYKISIITADQKGYIVNFRQQIGNMIANVFMIIALVITKNFIIYLLIQIIFSVLCNIYLSSLAEKMYPSIKNTSKYELGKKDKQEIKKNIIALMFHKIGGVVVTGTDNLIISKMIGLGSVGIYSNYVLIINMVNRFVSQFFSSILSSIGNLNVEKDKKYIYSVFKRIFFANAWIYMFCSVCLISLLNPFIELWLGKEYQFTFWIVLIIVSNFYFDGMRKTVLSFKEAMGLFWYDRYKPILETIVNLIFSILLTIKFGIVGVFAGTTISFVFVSTYIDFKVLFKYGFKMNSFEYIKLYVKYLISTILCLSATLLFNRLVIGNGIFAFTFCCLITVFIPNLIMLLINVKTPELNYYWKLLDDKLLQKVRKVVNKKCRKFIKKGI